jgi:hypothetical protein
VKLPFVILGEASLLLGFHWVSLAARGRSVCESFGLTGIWVVRATKEPLRWPHPRRESGVAESDWLSLEGSTALCFVDLRFDERFGFLGDL